MNSSLWSKNVKIQMASSDKETNLMSNAAFTIPENAGHSQQTRISLPIQAVWRQSSTLAIWTGPTS